MKDAQNMFNTLFPLNHFIYDAYVFCASLSRNTRVSQNTFNTLTGLG